MSTESKFYHPFNPLPENGKENEYRYKINPTSKMHVRRVCDVMAKRRGISDQLRCRYADQAGYPNVRRQTSDGTSPAPPAGGAPPSKGDSNPQFELFDVYSEYHVHAALAQAVFAGFPQIIEVEETKDGWKVEVVNEELFDRLDEGVVNEAFLSFSNNRSGIQQSLKDFSRKLPTDPSRPDREK